MKAAVRSTENISCRFAVLTSRSAMTPTPPSMLFFMVCAHAMATGSVRNAMMVANGMMPMIEHTPIHTNGNSTSNP